eukprot:TRINITY_DN64186_c0_g1_i1.p1 TRINITY_DN64186_c0_g1~~TRINITY_DN64186_c0_g1_i1.p1  ORF type:complete len:231 (+),score=25.86 TRINITY_DN64186_c0_g1_i1:1516-2208(+)
MICVANHVKSLSFNTRFEDGAYAQFCLQLVHTRSYRWGSWAILVFTWITCGALLTSQVGLFAFDIVRPFLESGSGSQPDVNPSASYSHLPDIGLDLIVTMMIAYRTAMLKTPTFQYDTKAFAELKFKRIWMNSSHMFADRVASALKLARHDYGEYCAGALAPLRNVLCNEQDGSHSLRIEDALRTLTNGVPEDDELTFLSGDMRKRARKHFEQLGNGKALGDAFHVMETE